MKSRPVIRALVTFLSDLLSFFTSSLRSRVALQAENLFLLEQLAFYREHQVRSQPLTDAARVSLVLWSRICDWKNALMIVRPETLIGWHRKGFRLFWHSKVRPGRPPVPAKIRHLIAQIVRENPTWGQARVADELALKLGIYISPRTVRKYWPWQSDDHRNRTSSRSWSTFVHNHANAIVACDFMVAVTARFQFLYVLLILEVGSRRILQCNVTAHPTAEWTLQQFREALPGENAWRLVVHDRDAIFSEELDKELASGLGFKVLRRRRNRRKPTHFASGWWEPCAASAWIFSSR